jgi:cytochrome c peroxidase
MRRYWCIPLVTAALVAGCKSGDKPTDTNAKASASVQNTAAEASAHASSVKEKPKANSLVGSSIARTPTGDALYLADEDRGVVLRVALPMDVANTPMKTTMPGQPAEVVVLSDKVLVTIRSAGAVIPAADKPDPSDSPEAAASASASASAKVASKAPAKAGPIMAKLVPSATGPGLLLVMRPDLEKGLVEVSRTPLPEDAWGVTVTADESLALITSPWTHKVSIVDIASGKLKATVDVPREPRRVIVHPNGKSAYVTHLIGPDLTRIDGIDTDAPTVRPVKLPPSPARTPLFGKVSASLAYSATLSPDGKKLFVPRHSLGGTGPQVWMGTSAVDVLLTEDDSPLSPPRTDKPRVAETNLEANFVLTDESTGAGGPRAAGNPFVQPRAVVYRKKKDTLLVVAEGLDSVVELWARTVEPSMFVRRTYSMTLDKDPKYGVSNGCSAPSGITLSDDEDTAWVFCRASASIVVLTLDTDGPRPWVRIGEDPLSAEAAVGRRLFHNGNDEITSGGMGCAGCHPEGRDDGHVWRETIEWEQERRFFAGKENIPDSPGDSQRGGFPRQTPMLAGRLAAEGPYGWHAESPHLTHRLTGGFHLHRWGTFPWGHHAKELHERAMAIRAYLRQGLVPPPRIAAELSDEEKKGKEIFLRVDTKCAGCHVPEMDYSDRAKYPVYAQLPTLKTYDDDEDKQYKTPSLKFVGGTAPYAHDGRFSTLEELIDLNEDRMGNTKQLTKPERAALVAYLRTL